ncbi:MAG: DinB family protein [Burkholderiaceae bacterium]
MDLCTLLKIQARANRLANRRLYAALAALPHSDFHAARVGFFPSLAATLNHLLAVDLYYVGALHGDTGLPEKYAQFAAADDVRALVERQRASDERLINFCDRLDAAGCDAEVAMDRGNGKVQRDLTGHVLSHLFMHQTHHRGQAHTMLSGTAASPPQLDEFLMPSDAPFRVADMAALGWDEAAVYGP